MVSSTPSSKKPRINAEMMQQVLGDSSNYLYENVSAQRLENIQNILLKAQEKFSCITKDKGSISPKLVRRIMNEGSFTNDKVAVEYFAGVIASLNFCECLFTSFVF